MKTLFVMHSRVAGITSLRQLNQASQSWKKQGLAGGEVSVEASSQNHLDS